MMNQHELIMLSPYRFPGQHLLTLADEDMACWLNAFTALWHPALLWEAAGPPRCDSQYDHEQPLPGCVYALPESPPLYLPDDWQERVKAVGSIVFTASTDREVTLANLKAALETASEMATAEPADPDSAKPAPFGWKEGLSLPADELGFFFGIGWGHLLHSSLVEAMEHDNALDAQGFWDDIQSAVAARAGLPYTPVPPSVTEGQEGRLRHGKIRPNRKKHWKRHGLGQSPICRRIRTIRRLRFRLRRLLSIGSTTCGVRQRKSRRPAKCFIRWPSTGSISICSTTTTWPTPGPCRSSRAIPSTSWLAGALLEKLGREQPEKLAILHERIQAEQAEVCGGIYREREDALLPVDSQLWNFKRGREVGVPPSGGPVEPPEGETPARCP